MERQSLKIYIKIVKGRDTFSELKFSWKKSLCKSILMNRKHKQKRNTQHEKEEKPKILLTN